MAEASAAPMAEEALNARLSRLLEEHGRPLSRVAAAYARTGADQKDLLQEIALALFRALPSFREECSERTFVFRVAHNQGITFVTRRSSARSRALEANAEGDSLERIPDVSASAEERIDAARRAERLWAAIRALPVASRAVVVLALEDLSHSEIAAIVGISVNNVAVRLTRARDELRRTLGGSDDRS